MSYLYWVLTATHMGFANPTVSVSRDIHQHTHTHTKHIRRSCVCVCVIISYRCSVAIILVQFSWKSSSSSSSSSPSSVILLLIVHHQPKYQNKLITKSQHVTSPSTLQTPSATPMAFCIQGLLSWSCRGRLYRHHIKLGCKKGCVTFLSGQQKIGKCHHMHGIFCPKKCIPFFWHTCLIYKQMCTIRKIQTFCRCFQGSPNPRA